MPFITWAAWFIVYLQWNIMTVRATLGGSLSTREYGRCCGVMWVHISNQWSNDITLLGKLGQILEQIHGLFQHNFSWWMVRRPTRLQDRKLQNIGHEMYIEIQDGCCDETSWNLKFNIKVLKFNTVRNYLYCCIIPNGFNQFCDHWVTD
jgi:hypothetical protein